MQLAKFPQITGIPKDKQIWCVFDDVVIYNYKEQGVGYIRGRKFGKGISMCYLSQSFFKKPTTIRFQRIYLVHFKLISKRNLNLILRDYCKGVDKY